MSLANLLSAHRSDSNHDRKNKRRRRPAGRKAVRSSSRARRFESLEDRNMLSAMSVVNTADSGPGSLRDAIVAANAAPDHDVISFAPSVHGTINLTSGELAITNDLTINGPGPGRLSISGNGQSRVFAVSGEETDVVMSHLTVSDGFVTGAFSHGGGISNVDATLSLSHVVVKDNRLTNAFTGTGAGIHNSGALNLDHVVVENNQLIDSPAGAGAGIGQFGGAVLYVSHSTFVHNVATGAPSGGAISNGGATAVVSNSRFIDNHVINADDGTSQGGAILNVFGGHLDVSNSLFFGNSASSSEGVAHGGAIANFAFGATANIEHSVFVGNWASGASAHGGAISNRTAFGAEASMNVNDCAIVNNWAAGDSALGGGVYNDDASFTLVQTNVNANRAIGEDGGDGIGGGIYNSGAGEFEVDEASNVRGNKASKSHDNVFGDLTVLQQLLADAIWR